MRQKTKITAISSVVKYRCRCRCRCRCKCKCKYVPEIDFPGFLSYDAAA